MPTIITPGLVIPMFSVVSRNALTNTVKTKFKDDVLLFFFANLNLFMSTYRFPCNWKVQANADNIQGSDEVGWGAIE
jgi:hypothetical protein